MSTRFAIYLAIPLPMLLIGGWAIVHWLQP
jgi:hypothetical protein